MSPFPPPSLRLKAPEASLRPVSSLRVQTVNVPLMFGRSPNISGQIQGNSDTWKMGGVFSYSSWTRGPGISSTGTTSISGSVLLDGMKSNSIFGQSETVQPPSIHFMPAIKF